MNEHSLIGQLFQWGVFSTALGISTVLSGAPEKMPPQVNVPQISAPKIDGVLEKGEWTNAGRLAPFTLCASGEKTDVATVGFLGCDDENLYIALICEEPQLSTLILESFDGHDKEVWKNDSIELLFQTDPESPVIRQFIIDALNQSYDALGDDSFSYNPDFASAVVRTENQWVLEAAIPFSALTDTPPVGGQEMRVGIYRSRPAGNELQAWSPTGGGFRVPERFGRLVFNSAVPDLLNRDTISQRVRADFGETLPKDIQSLVQELDAVLATAEAFDSTTSVAEYVESAEKMIRFANQYEEKSFYSQWLMAGFPVAFQSVNALDPASPAPMTAPPEKTLNATFLKEEVRDFAFVLTNLSEQPQTVQVLVQSDESAAVFKQGISGFALKQYTAYPVATYEKNVVYDLLAENPAGIYQIAPGTTVQSVISIQALPEAAEKNFAKLIFRPVDGAAWKPYELDLNFSVGDVSIQKHKKEFLAFGWDAIPPEVQIDHPLWAKSHFQALAEYGFNAVQISGKLHLPRPRVDADGAWTDELDFTNLDSLLSETKDRFEYYVLTPAVFSKHIQNEDLFGIPFDSPAFEKAYKAWLLAIFEHLEQQGIGQERILFTPDYESANEAALRICRWTKEVFPECCIFLNAIPYDSRGIDSFAPYVDIWMPDFDSLREKRVRYAEEIGENPLMIYFAPAGREEKIRHPFAEYTVKFWSCFDRNCAGLALAFAGTYSGDALYRASSPGYDTALFYPAGHTVQPSRRAFAWRRGMQDYLMLKQTENFFRERADNEKIAELHQKVKEVIQRFGHFNGAEEIRNFCRDVLSQKR